MRETIHWTVRLRAQILAWPVLVAAFVGLAGAQASAPDPIVGTWQGTGSYRVEVKPTGGASFVGRTIQDGSIGPCPIWPGDLRWELSKRADGTYAGTNHGRRWDSSDPKTCRDLPMGMTAQLGTISAGRLSMRICFEGTDVTQATCITVTRPAADPADAVVPIASVSNGCGGAGWRALVKLQNHLGNTSRFWNSEKGLIYDPRARPYTVDFSAACNLHDAGYAGAIVKDSLRGGIKDFRGWSRKKVDGKFLADMRLLCARQIEPSAVYALRNCRSTGGNVSVGAVSRFNFVRCFGSSFFDADLELPGTQKTGPRRNDIVGWLSSHCLFFKQP